MDLKTILTILITVLSLILEFLGGGNFSRSLTTSSQSQNTLSSKDIRCNAPVWTDRVHVESGMVVGTVSKKCDIFVRIGGGIVSLKSKLTQRLNNDFSNLLGGSLSNASLGLGLNIEASGQQTQIYGDVGLSTSSGALKHQFKSFYIPKVGALKYLQTFKSNLDVRESNLPDTYQVTLTQSFRIIPPAFQSSATATLAKQYAEIGINNRTEKILNDIGANF